MAGIHTVYRGRNGPLSCIQSAKNSKIGKKKPCLLSYSNYSFDDLYVEGARRVARLARECGVRKLIHVSQLNASLEPEPHLIMGGSKVLRAKALGNTE